LFESDRLKEALRCFDQVLQLEPEDCNALETKGEIYETLGQIDKAMECYMKALSVRTGSDKAEKLRDHIDQLRLQLKAKNAQKGNADFITIYSIHNKVTSAGSLIYFIRSCSSYCAGCAC
jgi:tetratricopeptide (TPR) repeat protein